MNRKEFLDSLKGISVKKEIEDKLFSVYGKSIPETVLKILSLYPSPELFDENESRTLSLNEVLNAEEDNGVAFKSRGIIPIADCGDNDFIVWDSRKNAWCMYNILDETLFSITEDFDDLFLK